MNSAAILLGSNMGDRLDNLSKATELIIQGAGVLAKASSIYETAPWGNVAQNNFLNRALLIDTKLAPLALLNKLLEIEIMLGRKRTEKWGPRTIDIDILYYNDEIVYEHNLKIPHPFLQDRRFSLVALNEISPDWKHPLLRKTISQMLEACEDPGWVKLYQ